MGLLDLLTIGGIIVAGIIYKDQILDFIDGITGPVPCVKTCGVGQHLDPAQCICIPDTCTKTCTAPQVLNPTTCMCETPDPGPGPGPGPGPTPGTDTITLALVGDNGKNLGGPVASQIVKQKPNYYIGLGDYGYSSFSGFKVVADAMKNANIPMYLTMGNHDTGDAGSFVKASVNPGGKWLWTKNFNSNLSIICLNSEASGSTIAEAENLLKQATGKFKIVIYHSAVYSCKAAGSLDDGKIASVHPLFSKYGVNMVFAGHNHYYWRSKPCPGLPTYLVVGTGGHELNACRPEVTAPCSAGEATHSDNTFGFVLLTVSSSGMTGKYITKSGQILDSFTG